MVATSAMRIKLSDIPEEGLTVSESLDPLEMNLQAEGWKFLGPLAVSAAFYKERDTVLVRVDASGNAELVCGRCLSVFSRPYEGHFHLDYLISKQLVLDVTDDIRQEILLSYPLILLCQANCRGLCFRCGKNLNLEECSCSTTTHGTAQA